MTPKSTFAQRYEQGMIDAVAKKGLKIARRTPESLSTLSMRVYSTGELRRAQSLGWVMEAPLSLGRGAGPMQYLMTIDRETLRKTHITKR